MRIRGERGRKVCKEREKREDVEVTRSKELKRINDESKGRIKDQSRK